MPQKTLGNSLSILLPVFNSEKTVRECLETVKWADEILVVDSFSTDSTLDICREYTPRILQHEYINSAKQKNWAMEQIRTEWVLQIDSDEWLEPGLCDEIMEALAHSDDVDGFRVRIKNHVWGKWTRSCGLYPCTQVRLFRAAKGRWSDRQVHAHLQGLESVKDLQQHILHHDVEDVAAELLQFASQVMDWEFKELVKRGKRWRWWDVTLRPTAIFLIYFLRYGGCREGFHGFYLSVYRAFYSFMTYARLYEDEVDRGLKS